MTIEVGGTPAAGAPMCRRCVAQTQTEELKETVPHVEPAELASFLRTVEPVVAAALRKNTELGAGPAAPPPTRPRTHLDTHATDGGQAAAITRRNSASPELSSTCRRSASWMCAPPALRAPPWPPRRSLTHGSAAGRTGPPLPGHRGRPLGSAKRVLSAHTDDRSTGGVIAVSYAARDHVGWCQHRSRVTVW
jgi:hypothetical protein